jgi:hypothetical protein
MFTAILATQWKWSRFPLLLLALAAFALPLLSSQQLNPENGYWTPMTALEGLQSLGVFYPALAGAAGLILAVTAWAADHRGRHVYALSLPLPRWLYALLRMGAGATLLLVPTAALGLGAAIASLATTLPQGLHAYPTMLTLRFGLAALVAYGLFFAVSAGTSRTAAYMLGAIVAVVLLQVVVNLFDWKVQILEPVLYRLYIWPGPLEIFVGRWMLFDV